MNTQKTPLLDKLYMLLLTLLPVFAIYRVGSLDLDVVLMLAFFAIFLFSSKFITITSVGKPIALLVVYILLSTSINLLVGERFSAKTEVVLRMGRYCLYLLMVFFFGNKHATYREFMRIYRILVYAAIFYLFLQAVFYYGFGIMLHNKIGASSVSENAASVGRLRSFYSEPADLGYNMIPFLACSLFGEKYKADVSKDNSLDALLVSVAIVMSTSGQGVICAGLIWGFWLLNHIFKEGLRPRDILILVGAVVAIIVLYFTGILEYTISRAESSGEGSAIDARASGYVSLALLSPLQLLFGTGFGNYIVENTFDLEVYYQYVNYSSLAEFLFTLGIFGTAILLGFFVYLFRKGTGSAKIMILSLLFLSLLGCPMTGKHFPLWLTLICVQLPEGLYAPKVETLTSKGGPFPDYGCKK